MVPLSADHIEYATDARRRRRPWPQAGTVGVILPGAFYTLRETQAPPVSDLLRKHNVPMAVGDGLQSRFGTDDLACC